MSLRYQLNNVSFIDHRDFVNKLYGAVPENVNVTSYEISDKLFTIIIAENKKKPSRKRCHDSDMHHLNTVAVKQMYQDFFLDIPKELKASLSKANKILTNTSDVRDYASKIFESNVFDHAGINGGNNSNQPLKCIIKDQSFLIPPKSRFFCGCVKEECKKLNGSKFDVLIADPPWWNKFIRRLKNSNEKLSYSMMYNEDIASIPVKGLLSENCLVAVWCTNAPSNIQAVKNLIFPRWGVTYLTTWYWLKVANNLVPICQFGSGNKKQPYERLIIGRVGDVNVPESKLIVSVPSALHSHKPPLLDLLSPYVKSQNPQTLELFARYLLPNTTSIGYEPLKWQHISLYETSNLMKINAGDEL